MIKKTIHHILRRTHFWRSIGFDELSELYVSATLRTFAVSMLMVFIPFYLYQHGYTVQQIFVFFLLYFVGKFVSDIMVAHFIARFGPKHAMLVSCFLQITAALCLISIPAFGWLFWLAGPVTGMAASFFFIAFHVEFSKIKHAPHAGKELGYMQIFEKLASVLGPLSGGLAGAYLGSQYIFVVAAIVLIASLWPLFRTAEPVRTHQAIHFESIPLTKLKRDYLSYVGLGVENTLCVNLWPLYISLFALGGSVYAKLGMLTSASVMVSITVAYLVGKYIDTKDARRMLRAGAIINALIYAIRPFVHTTGAAFVTSVCNDAVNPGYRMPYLKGMYAAADELPGYRIAYIASMEAMGSLAKASAWGFLAVLAGVCSNFTVITVGFAVAAAASFIIMSEHFRALNTGKSYA